MNSDAFILSALEYPDGRLDVVLDTDTYNEIDDQFALAYLIKSPERVNLQAVYAAPFFNANSVSPADGMEKSYMEIEKVLALCKRSDLWKSSYRGADRYLPDEKTPVCSDAAKDLVERAKSRPEGKPLYVVAIAALTNIASALLLAPEISRKIVVVWLGGHAYDWPDTIEFNMYQDIAAVRVVFGSGVPLVQIPCMGMVSHLSISGPELDRWLVGRNELCDYLCNIVKYQEETVRGRLFWSRIIWDVGAVAWLMNRGFTMDITVSTPIVSYDGQYCRNGSRHPMKYVTYINRDSVFEDLFDKLTGGLE